MSMEIADRYNYYAEDYENAIHKSDSAKGSKSKKEGNVITTTVELKTSTPGVTKTEQIKTGFGNVEDYSRYLQGKYRFMNTGLTSMQGVPTRVLVSGAFLKKCMDDPQKAAYLEENLAAIPDCASYAVSHAQGTLTSLSFEVDANGNMTIISSGTNDPDGKIARENMRRKAQENKKAQEKADKRRTEEEEEAKRREKKRASKEIHKVDGEYSVRATGMDMKAVMRDVVQLATGANVLPAISFDAKA